MLYLLVEFGAVGAELLLFDFGLFFELHKLVFSLIACIIGLGGECDGVLDILLFLFELFFEFEVDVFHGVFFLS